MGNTRRLPCNQALGRFLMNEKISIRLFGSFSLQNSNGNDVRIPSAKIKAMLAMLITSANGCHTRAWLQKVLWGLTDSEHGRSSLRRALSDLRKIMFEDFDNLFELSNADIKIDQSLIEVIGTPKDGDFLEGIEIHGSIFNTWLSEKRVQNENGLLKLPSEGNQNISPSVAIIPFASATNSKDEIQFGDLIALEVTRTLSRSAILDVISHLSARQFQLKSLNLSKLRESLNVQYLVFGNVVRDGDNFRLHADFVDLESERVHWTRQFDFTLKDIISGDENVSQQIATSIGQTIFNVSLELATSQPLMHVENHTLLMAAIGMMHKTHLGSFSKARVFLEELIERSPKQTILYAWLAKWYVLSAHQGWSINLQRDAELAQDYTKRALDINPNCSFSLTIDGLVQSNLKKSFSASLSQWDQALGADPNNSLAWLLKGTMFAFTDRGSEAVSLTNKARHLSPLDPHKYYYDCLSATARLTADDFEAAEKLALRSYEANRRHTSTLRVLTIAQQCLGKDENAKETAGELMKLEPKFTVENYLKNHPAAEFKAGQAWAKALGAAGIPIK